jgi:hypothetical protein
VAEANYRGGLDNITAIVVQVQRVEALDEGGEAPTVEGPALATDESNEVSPGQEHAA